MECHISNETMDKPCLSRSKQNNPTHRTEEPLPAPITSYPLPAEYWTRPIEGQNTDWWSISSHWLGSEHPLHYNVAAADAMYQPDGELLTVHT
jgi:hypothetical protein